MIKDALFASEDICQFPFITHAASLSLALLAVLVLFFHHSNITAVKDKSNSEPTPAFGVYNPLLKEDCEDGENDKDDPRHV